jgi:hypothetical protein
VSDTREAFVNEMLRDERVRALWYQLVVERGAAVLEAYTKAQHVSPCQDLLCAGCGS